MSDSPLKQTVPPETGLKSTLPWRRWLYAFDCYNFATNTAFTSAIWVIYLATHGYSPLTIGLLEMTFHIAKFVAEVPTGIFADLVGRRKSLIIFCAISALETLLFLFPTVPFMILSFALAGISFAFRGGANEAILWTIAGYAEPEQQSARYSRLFSRMFMVGLVGEIIGTATGGYLGHILQILPFIFRAVFAALGIIPLLFIPEKHIMQAPDIDTLKERLSPLAHLGVGLRATWQTPALLGLVLISGLVESCWQTIYFYYQLYLNGRGFSLATIGIIFAGSTLVNFLATAATPRIMCYIPERWLLPLCVGIQIAGLFLMSLSQPWISLFGYLILFQVSVSVLAPAISTYINQRSPEAQRATILSFQTGMFSAAMIVLFPLFGLGVAHASYSTVYIWTLEALVGGSIVIGGLVWLREIAIHKR